MKQQNTRQIIFLQTGTLLKKKTGTIQTLQMRSRVNGPELN